MNLNETILSIHINYLCEPFSYENILTRKKFFCKKNSFSVKNFGYFAAGETLLYLVKISNIPLRISFYVRISPASAQRSLLGFTSYEKAVKQTLTFQQLTLGFFFSAEKTFENCPDQRLNKE